MKEAPMMHVPVSFRPELRNSQNELKSAIHKHQLFLAKLKESPTDVELKIKIKNIQEHIIRLGLRQKKIVERLRNEIGSNKTKFPEKQKHLKPPTPDRKLPRLRFDRPVNVAPSPQEIALTATTGSAAIATPSESEQSVSDAESAATGDVAPTSLSTQCTPVKNNTSATTPSNCAKRSPSHSPPLYSSICDRHNRNNRLVSQVRVRKGSRSPTISDESQDSTSENKVFDAALNNKLAFMTAIGLVTREVFSELQGRRFERKRRSTANPQFVYGNSAEHAAKRKKYGTNGSQNGEVKNFTSANRLVASPNATCLVCSSAKGVLCVCWSCRRAFHWSCTSDTPLPPPTFVAQLHCPSCDTSSNASPPVSESSDKEFLDNELIDV